MIVKKYSSASPLLTCIFVRTGTSEIISYEFTKIKFFFSLYRLQPGGNTVPRLAT